MTAEVALDPRPLSTAPPRPGWAGWDWTGADAGLGRFPCFMPLNSLAHSLEDALPWSVNRVEEMAFICWKN